MQRVIVLVLLVVASFLSPALAAGPGQLKILTEQYPPFNYEEEGHVKGMVTELVQAILNELHIKDTIKVVPWARGYYLAQTEPNTCLFSMTLTPERKPLFKWAGPVATTEVALVRLKKNQQIQINQLEDVNNYKVGVIRSDIGEQLLMNNTLVDKSIIQPVDRTVLNIRKLMKGRIDLISYGWAPLLWEIKKNDMDPADFQPAFILKKGQLFIAFHKETPDAVVQDFQKTLDKLKADGTYNRIVDSYLK